MLLSSISNINVAIKKNQLVVFEKFSPQLLNVLKALWLKKLITGYTLLENKVKIVLKYSRGVPVVRLFKIISKPGNKIYKKLKEKNCLFVISNSSLGICITDTSIKGTLSGKILFKIII